MWSPEEFPWIPGLQKEWVAIREMIEEVRLRPPALPGSLRKSSLGAHSASQYHRDFAFNYANGDILGYNNAYGQLWHALPIFEARPEFGGPRERFPALSRLLERLNVPVSYAACKHIPPL